MARTAPRQKPGKSKQDYQTPVEFLCAVCAYLDIGGFELDVAADADNAVANLYYDEAMDALAEHNPWHGEISPTHTVGVDEWAWLNPPFGNIGPWVKKAYRTARAGGLVAVLVPASLGANWWRDYVHEKCRVVGLNGRITFVGQPDPYPKDCALLLYGYHGDYDIWTWPDDAP